MFTRSYGFKKEVVIEEHRILKDAILSRKEDAAIKALQSHLGITADIIQKLQLPMNNKATKTTSAPATETAAKRSAPKKARGSSSQETRRTKKAR